MADVKIQCLAEPWSYVVSPPSRKACAFAQCRAGDAFLIRDVLLACIRCLSGQHARCSFVAEGVMGRLQILGSDPESTGAEKQASFLGL